jgi:hypothetical protein
MLVEAFHVGVHNAPQRLTGRPDEVDVAGLVYGRKEPDQLVHLVLRAVREPLADAFVDRLRWPRIQRRQ